MKGQISYIIKPMMLIGVVVLLVFLLQTLYSNRAKEELAEKNLDAISTATNVLLILANSDQCLAYRSLVTDKTQASVLDVNKLDQFSLEYQEMEPECARNYEFGWKVDVEQIGEDGPEEEWTFGVNEFSTGELLNNEVRFWVPVAIKYLEGDVRYPEGATKLGKMYIRLVNGELEKLAGFFDWSCRMGELDRMTSSSTEIAVSQVVTYDESIPGVYKLCMGSSCRKLICQLFYFDGLGAKGTYELTVNYQEPKRLLVGK